jgi:hypothetical protein
MNPAAPFQPAALTTAVQRVKIAARDAALRCVDALGVAALASSKSGEREDLLAAQFELNRKQTAFVMSFNEKLDEVVAAELRRLDASNAKINSKIGSSWQSLSLVDDREVEIQVSAERVGMTLQHECEWELRELDTLMMGLLHSASRGEVEVRNPLRPELLGRAMVRACDSVTDRPEVRQALADHMARALANAMPQLYGTIAGEMKAAGVRPPEIAVRTTQGPGNELGQFTNTGYDTMGRPVGMDSGAGTGPDSGSGRMGGGGGGSGGGGAGRDTPAKERPPAAATAPACRSARSTWR